MKNIYSVAQVNSYIKNMFVQDFLLQSLHVRGEVSNCKYHSSGHIYFTLKDEKGTIACVMFAGNRSGLSFRLAEGMQVIVQGSIDVYERDGKYQLYAKEIKQDGTGLLYERFEALKKELEEMGMFSAEYKQPVPRYIRTLGVVTAPAGAAVRDIMQIALRRNPYVQIILYPAIVQGEQAAASIANGIHALEKLNVDIIIIGRGGGSMEDLWAFNERFVAQAVFDCKIPVISAVGHETDITITDFVADLRAPTPSAAAEIAVYEYGALQGQMLEYAQTLRRLIQNKCTLKHMRAKELSANLRRVSPAGKLRQNQTYLLKLEENLQEAVKNNLLKKRHRLEISIARLKGLSPLDKLNQGFSYAEDETGCTLTDIKQAKPGSLIKVHVKNGRIEAQVKKTERIER